MVVDGRHGRGGEGVDRRRDVRRHQVDAPSRAGARAVVQRVLAWGERAQVELVGRVGAAVEAACRGRGRAVQAQAWCGCGCGHAHRASVHCHCGAIGRAAAAAGAAVVIYRPEEAEAAVAVSGSGLVQARGINDRNSIIIHSLVEL